MQSIGLLEVFLRIFFIFELKLDTMDLQARKLVFIEEYVRLADEKIVLKLEKLLRSEKEKAIK